MLDPRQSRWCYCLVGLWQIRWRTLPLFHGKTGGCIACHWTPLLTLAAFAFTTSTCRWATALALATSTRWWTATLALATTACWPSCVRNQICLVGYSFDLLLNGLDDLHPAGMASLGWFLTLNRLLCSRRQFYRLCFFQSENLAGWLHRRFHHRRRQKRDCNQ